MDLYRFVSEDGRHRALTQDRDGRRLPGVSARWDFLGLQDTDDARLGVAAGEILTAVDREGYFLLTPR